MSKYQTKSIFIHIINFSILIIALIFFLFPIFWMFLTSIKSPFETFLIPPVWIFQPTWENYINTFLQGQYYKYFWNSFIITTLSIVFATILASLMAYGTTRFRFRGKTTFLLGLLIFYMIPEIAYAIPLFLLFGRLGILDTKFTLILVFTALTIPFSTWVLHGYFQSIPRELEDSALIDGCSRLGALFRIILPLSAPGIAATMILTFITTWNNFLFPAILGGTKTQTLPVAVAGFITDTRIEWGQASAVASVIILPVLILIVLGQKLIIQGLVSGAVKE